MVYSALGASCLRATLTLTMTWLVTHGQSSMGTAARSLQDLMSSNVQAAADSNASRCSMDRCRRALVDA
jgi:hypothetical protein